MSITERVKLENYFKDPTITINKYLYISNPFATEPIYERLELVAEGIKIPIKKPEILNWNDYKSRLTELGKKHEDVFASLYARLAGALKEDKMVDSLNFYYGYCVVMKWHSFFIDFEPKDVSAFVEERRELKERHLKLLDDVYRDVFGATYEELYGKPGKKPRQHKEKSRLDKILGRT